MLLVDHIVYLSVIPGSCLFIGWLVYMYNLEGLANLCCLYVNDWLKDVSLHLRIPFVCSLIILLYGTRKPSRIVHISVCNETYKYKCTRED